MKKLVYAMLIGLVGSPPAFAQLDERSELTIEEQDALEAEKDIARGQGSVDLSAEAEAQLDAEKAAAAAAEEAAERDSANPCG
ncbi:MAG: hypothetical protein HKN78_00120 [Sphingomonadaceae bacterium]|nr:hypothetical protein [Sphingomonadaceae bacterium]